MTQSKIACMWVLTLEARVKTWKENSNPNDLALWGFKKQPSPKGVRGFNLAMHIEAPKCNQIQNFFVGEKKVSMGQQSVKNPMWKLRRSNSIDWIGKIPLCISIYLVKKEGSLFCFVCHIARSPKPWHLFTFWKPSSMSRERDHPSTLDIWCKSYWILNHFLIEL
jgi:hypothetical protein